MIPQEFQNRYSNYRAQSERLAQEEAIRANNEGIDNDHAVAVEFPSLGWCLMLESAYAFIAQLGIGKDKEDKPMDDTDDTDDTQQRAAVKCPQCKQLFRLE